MCVLPGRTVILTALRVTEKVRAAIPRDKRPGSFGSYRFLLRTVLLPFRPSCSSGNGEIVLKYLSHSVSL
jgi:hypothetical protein